MRKLIFLLMGFFLWQSALSQRPVKYITLRDSVTRPSDATAYAVGDAMTNTSRRFLVFTLPRNLGSFEIVQGVCLSDTGNAMGVILHLVNDTTGITSVVDNSALTYTFLNGNASRYIASLRGLNTIAIAGNREPTFLTLTNASSTTSPPISYFVAGNISGKLFGYVEIGAIFTPKNAGVYHFTITIKYVD